MVLRISASLPPPLANCFPLIWSITQRYAVWSSNATVHWIRVLGGCGTVLMSHSQSGIYPFQTAVLSRKGIAGIVSIEPGACPAPTDDMAPYANLPILVLFGDYVDEFPRWAPRLKNCRAFVAAANAAGGKAELLVLPDIGIKGTTHMLLQDDNSLVIADILLDWIGELETLGHSTVTLQARPELRPAQPLAIAHCNP